jgi:hypothetical protein
MKRNDEYSRHLLTLKGVAFGPSFFALVNRWTICGVLARGVKREKAHQIKRKVMKKNVCSLAVLWVLSLCPSVGFAQSSRPPALAVKVPFEFVLGGQVFPAGTYKFRSLLNPVDGKDNIDVLEVRNVETRLYRAIVTDVVAGEEMAKAKLVFARRGAAHSYQKSGGTDRADP